MSLLTPIQIQSSSSLFVKLGMLINFSSFLVEYINSEDERSVSPQNRNDYERPSNYTTGLNFSRQTNQVRNLSKAK